MQICTVKYLKEITDKILRLKYYKMEIYATSRENTTSVKMMSQNMAFAYNYVPVEPAHLRYACSTRPALSFGFKDTFLMCPLLSL